MSDIDVTLRLPEDLVADAQAAGILTDQRVVEWLTSELERNKRIQVLLDDVEKLHALEPPLTQKEIDAELKAYRQEKSRK